jgi:hypothetical protein
VVVEGGGGRDLTGGGERGARGGGRDLGEGLFGGLQGRAGQYGWQVSTWACSWHWQGCRVGEEMVGAGMKAEGKIAHASVCFTAG